MKFNQSLKQKTRSPNTVNLAGGQAHATSAKLELVSIMLTSFLGDQFYQTADETATRLIQLINECGDKQFVAKLALYARREAGMRSVSHLVAGELAHSVKGQEWTKRFFKKVVFRPDDVLEILAYCLAVYGKPIPNALKKGLGEALAGFDDYQLAKYRRDSAELKMVDAVNLVHPPHSEALRRLVEGTLPPAETWETKLTQAGQAATSDTDKAVRKAEAWASLIRKKKLGYFALLRNLRNILEQAPELTDEVTKLLQNENLIRRSLVLPFRFRTALEAVEEIEAPPGTRRKVVSALNNAADRSLANVPRFGGRTLVAMDCSGSMLGQPMKIGSLFAAALYKSNEADLMLFASDARFETFNHGDATLSIAQRIEEKAEWGGTNFHAIFERAERRYDRVIILSDMQAWVGVRTPRKAFNDYVSRAGQRPRIYSFDLAGHGSLQFPEPEVYTLAGFSDKALETMKFLEQDKQALIRRIESIDL